MINDLSGITIEGIACCVPSTTLKTEDISYFSETESAKFINGTGIKTRRIAPPDVYASDLCLSAAKSLISSLNTDLNEIDVLIFVTQTADYIIPSTSTILQHKLGLKNTTMAFDITLGCSGYVYGLGVISSLLKTFNFKRGLLLAGDTSSKTSDPLDRSVWPLFGDAGSATLVCNNNSNSKMSFEFCTDGSRYKAIIKPQSGYKKMETSETPFLKLDSIGIFNFTMKEVPESIKRVLEKNEIEIDRVDIFALHQANKVINETIGKKLKLRNEQLLSSISDYGNTSSASIPMTLTANLQSFEQNQKIVLSGFGVGLSWSTVLIQNMNTKIFPIQEL